MPGPDPNPPSVSEKPKISQANISASAADPAVPGRLIGVDSAGKFVDADSPAGNMAIDQTLLESVDRSGVPCLRMYRWRQPTLSLGYFQKLEQRQSHLESQPLHCVRRASGGGAIVHHHELTYSIAIRNDHPSLSKRSSNAEPGGSSNVAAVGANSRLYRMVHDAIASTLNQFGVTAQAFRTLGRTSPDSDSPPDASSDASLSVTPASAEPFLCFQRRTSEDLIVAGYKVLGSAQRRGKRSLLQHGSLLIRASSFAPQLPGVVNLGAQIGAAENLIQPLVQRLKQGLNVQWRPDPITDDERSRSTEIAGSRFDSDAWTRRR